MTPARPEASTARALAWLYSPPQQRPLLAALIGVEGEIGASLKAGVDHQVAHARLEWWRAECARCAAGEPTHPLTQAALACFAGGDPAPLAGLGGLVDAAVWDLAAATFETRQELRAYCDRWAEAMIVPLARLASPELDPAAARALGAALRQGELLSRLAPDARAGRLRLPIDELTRAPVDPACLARPPWPAALAALLREQHALLRAQLAAAVRALPPAAQPALRALMVWAAIGSAGSRRAERRLPHTPPQGDDQGLLDGWRAWRAARRASGGRFALE
jgi:15-cis-phytoene synthase